MTLQLFHHGFIQQRTISLEPGSPLQIVPRQRTADRQVTWTGPGFVRVRDGAGLRFTVDNLPSSLDYQLVVRYESEVQKQPHVEGTPQLIPVDG